MKPRITSLILLIALFACTTQQTETLPAAISNEGTLIGGLNHLHPLPQLEQPTPTSQTINPTNLITVAGPANIINSNRAHTQALQVLPNGTDIRVRLKLLLVAATTNDSGFNAMQTTLRQIGIPFETLIADNETLTTSKLESSVGLGNYQGIILTTPNLALESGVSAFDSDEWALLQEYERRYSARQAVLYAAPSEEQGLVFTGSKDTLDHKTSLEANLSNSGTKVFLNLQANAKISITGSWIFLAQATGATPLLQSNNGAVLASTFNTTDGREVLALTMSHDDYSKHTALLFPGLARWVSRNIFLGEERINFATHIDDYFQSSDIWDASTKQNRFSYRMTANDLQNFVTWQNSFRNRYPLFQDFVADIFYNGRGFQTTATNTCTGIPPTGDDGLSAYTKCLSKNFRYVNHTWSHPRLDYLNETEIRNELQKNIDIAPTMGLGANFTSDALVTGMHSGLGAFSNLNINNGKSTANPNLISAATGLGLRFLGSDSTAPTTAPACTSTPDDCNQNNPYPREGLRLPSNLPSNNILLTPRFPGGVYWNTSTAEEQLDEYNYLNGQNQNYDEMLNNISDQMMWRAMNHSLNPFFYHQANLRLLSGNRTLFTDLLERFATKYSATFKLPATNLSMHDIGIQMLRRNYYRISGQNAIWNKTTEQIFIYATNPQTFFPLTNPKIGDTYGPDLVTYVQNGAVINLGGTTTPPPSPPPIGLTAPTGFTATATNSNSVVLTWNASTGASNYNLERRIGAGGTYTSLGNTSNLRLVDGSTIASTNYQYRINATNSSSNSTWTETSVTTPAVGAVLPTIRSVAPWGASIDANTYLAITFNQTMQANSVSITVSPSISFGAPLITTNGTYFKFTPGAALTATTKYTVTVSGKDLAGNDISGNFLSWSFTTK